MSTYSRTAWLGCVSLCVLGCSNNSQPPQQPAVKQAQELVKAIKGNGKQCAACTMFTPAEIELMLGAPVSAGETTGPLGTMCRWTGSTDENAHLDIQIIDDTHYWAKQSLDRGYEKLDGIAKEAFVVPDVLGGFTAQALTEKQIVAVGIDGGSASRDAAVAALRTVLDRLQKNSK